MDKIIKQAIFANGCFWCTEAVFQRLEGVIDVVSGYTGGHIKNPAYREVCNGTTGHAEAIRIDFDPKVISYQTLLEVFFVTHDPTTLNRQGNDVGTQYRSAIFYIDETQKNEANDFIETLTKAAVFKDTIVTQLKPLDIFYIAETSHHNYYNQNKEQAYCNFTITPKIEKIQHFFADKLKQNEHSVKYNEPSRKYDSDYVATKDDIETFPDLQNGPSSLIQGSPVAIQQVGIHNFRLPLKYSTRDNGDIELETKVTGAVSLEAHKKGINMSRIMRSFYEFKDDTFSIDKLKDILLTYQDKLKTFDSRIALKFSYPIIKKSLRSDNEGYQYYNVTLEGDMNKKGELKKYIHFDFVYSSACPCSYELAEYARKHRNKATVSHSQRSVARISIEFDDMVWIEELQEMCDKALSTETQVVVKREDEMAFAELNGSYLKFVEDAARLLYEQLIADKRIKDFRIICSHQESLHSHDAISVILHPNSNFCPDVSHETWSSLIHIS